MNAGRSVTIQDLEREAAQIALSGSETYDQAFERLLVANPEVYAAYRLRHDRSTSSGVCEAAGVEERTLRAWQLRGLLKMKASPAGEKWRRYTFADVVCVALMKRITQAGFSARHAAEIINDNRKYWEANPSGRYYLLVKSTENGIEYGGTNAQEDLISTLYPFGSPEPAMVTVIAVHRVADEVKAKLLTDVGESPHPIGSPAT
jgi:DNA-binding transcriptional MerR regulator